MKSQTLQKPVLFSGSLLWLALAANCFAQSGGQSTPPADSRRQVRVTQLKPEMVNEWLAIEKAEVIPALKKAGIASRTLLQNAFGNIYEYRSITPLDSYSTLDGDIPLVRALGKDAGARLQAKLAKCIASQQVFVATRVTGLSSPPDPKNPAPVWVTTTYRTAPGKAQEYESFLKSDVLPAYEKAKAAGKIVGYSVSRRGLGANNRDRTLVVYLNKFSDLDAGSPLTQMLGQEAAARIAAKRDTLATVVETVVRRRVSDLSY